ncbi:MAG: UDP-N-acetylmuramoyl-L-alanine--D-glutamate ligase [Phycisphaerae bacterium]|nr:UDP-N-acetylmuramoyl-L-alanine--D-glutamate ligase [Phycisphaerae bacterium]
MNKKVTVVGLGHFGGGVGVTRWLCGQGAIVTVTDSASPETLASSVAQLADLNVTFHLGGHDEADFTRADLLVVNPAVPKNLPCIEKSHAASVRRTSEINLFLERCPCPVVGVTGSVGKSTTTAMIGEILARRFTTHVGGNIGGSLLTTLGDIRPNHVVVLELSSFQLEDLPRLGISPRVAVVTNLKPNHLDRHGTMEHYADAKKNIFRFQRPDDVLVLNADDSTTVTWAEEARGRVVFFHHKGARGRKAEPFELLLPGMHNQDNAQAAWAAASQLGVDRATAADALKNFTGLEHRLQFVAERGGVRFYNDSKCTTPEGAIVALEAFPSGKIVILVGGSDKGVSFASLGVALAQRAKCVITLGATRDQLFAAVEDALRRDDLPAAPDGLGVLTAESFDEAVALAVAHAEPGDVVLLSPACASYDMFTNYEERGRRFVELVT